MFASTQPWRETEGRANNYSNYNYSITVTVITITVLQLQLTVSANPTVEFF